MTERDFPTFDETTAPGGARELLAKTKQTFGGIPRPLGRYASSPLALSSALGGLDAFEHTSLTPLEREVLAMTMGRRNGCKFCLDLHTQLLRRQQAEPRLIAALTTGEPLEEPRLEALRRFVLALQDHHGDIPHQIWSDFREMGYTHEQALEVVLGVSTYTLTTLANRLTQTSE